MKRSTPYRLLALLLTLSALLPLLAAGTPVWAAEGQTENGEKKYIKWIDFTVPEAALSAAMKLDIESRGQQRPISWIELLSFLGAKYGGEWRNYRRADLDALISSLGDTPVRELAQNKKLYDYYTEAYGAILSGMVGEYFDRETGERKYGLIAFSPFAEGYYYSHFDDFGASRSYGYRRPHLGHDMMGSVGTPIIAIEGGYVEAAGWNQYGGWRIGIRSFDNKRYYYYAHLRRGHPYNDIYEGKTVEAGEVIGYLGMTGYSAKEDTNNINTPHLHVGLQIIFDSVQKDGNNQIWIDMLALTNLLSRHRAKVRYDETAKEYHSESALRAVGDPD